MARCLLWALIEPISTKSFRLNAVVRVAFLDLVVVLKSDRLVVLVLPTSPFVLVVLPVVVTVLFLVLLFRVLPVVMVLSFNTTKLTGHRVKILVAPCCVSQQILSVAHDIYFHLFKIPMIIWY